MGCGKGLSPRCRQRVPPGRDEGDGGRSGREGGVVIGTGMGCVTCSALHRPTLPSGQPLRTQGEPAVKLLENSPADHETVRQSCTSTAKTRRQARPRPLSSTTGLELPARPAWNCRGGSGRSWPGVTGQVQHGGMGTAKLWREAGKAGNHGSRQAQGRSSVRREWPRQWRRGRRALRRALRGPACWLAREVTTRARTGGSGPKSN